MPKSGPRPHTWIVQGFIPHQQYRAWQQSKAQASFRGESWDLSFEQYQQLWLGHWDQKGRKKDGVCLTRDDPTGAWSVDNCRVRPRLEHLKRQKTQKRRNGNGINESGI